MKQKILLFIIIKIGELLGFNGIEIKTLPICKLVIEINMKNIKLEARLKEDFHKYCGEQL